MAAAPTSVAFGRAGWVGLGVLALLAGALWWRYGGTVFTELMTAAWRLCF